MQILNFEQDVQEKDQNGAFRTSRCCLQKNCRGWSELRRQGKRGSNSGQEPWFEPNLFNGFSLIPSRKSFPLKTPSPKAPPPFSSLDLWAATRIRQKHPLSGKKTTAACSGWRNRALIPSCTSRLGVGLAPLTNRRWGAWPWRFWVLGNRSFGCWKVIGEMGYQSGSHKRYG